MRITPIPDNELVPGARRVVVGPPVGHDVTGDIRPLEAEYASSQHGPVFSVRCVLEPDDLEMLAAGGAVWLSLFGHVVPISVAVRPAP